MDPFKLAHTGDPEVSVTAAISLTGGPKSEQVMRAIVHLLDKHGPLTPDQLEAAYFRDRAENDWPVVDMKFVHKRASEMKVHVHVLRGTRQRVKRAEPLELRYGLVTALGVVEDYWHKDAA